MQAIIGYDKGIKEKHLTIHLTEQDVDKLYLIIAGAEHREDYIKNTCRFAPILANVLSNFYNANDQQCYNVDGENGALNKGIYYE